MIWQMEALKKILRGKKHIVFFDLEGTQLSHEIIEIGAIGVSIGEDCKIKKYAKGFSCYVKAKSPIGHYVTEMTGITEKTLQNKGLIYHEAIEKFKKYVSRYKGDVIFCSYGNGDIFMLEQTAFANFDDGADFVRFIKKNYFDYSLFLGQYVKSEKGNIYSVTNALKLFDAIFEGTAHDALSDAKNLANLYEQFLEQKDTVAALYKKTLSAYRSLPLPVQKVMNQLRSGKSVDQDDYMRFIKESLD